MRLSPILLIIAVQVILLVVIYRTARRELAQRKARRRAEEQMRKDVTTFVEREHPVLGTYRERGDQTWWSTVSGEGLGGVMTLCGKGTGPTDAQIERWREIEARLPELLARVPAPPADDGWGNTFGPFDVARLRASQVNIEEELGFCVLVEATPLGTYHLFPIITVTRNWRTEVEWTV